MAGITPIGLLIGGLALWAPMVRAETMSPEAILAFSAGSLANGECLVRSEQLSQQQVNQATAIALQEMGISAAFLENL